MARIASSITALAGAGTWTSGTLLTDVFDTIAGSVFADQAGTVYIEQSFDGVNFDTTVNYAVTASTGVSFTEPMLAPYYRVRFVNGATPNTIFRIFSRATAAGNKY